MTPVRVGAVAAVALAALSALCAYETVALADGAADALAAAVSAALGAALALPRTPARRSILLPAAAIGAAAIVARTGSTGAEAALFAVFGGYFLATLLRVVSRVARLAGLGR